MAIAQGKRRPGWFMSVQRIPTQDGISHPRFRWVYRGEDDVYGGTLDASPLRGDLVLQYMRENKEDSLAFLSVDAALRAVTTYGWGEPPHIRDVFRDSAGAYEKHWGMRYDSKEVKRMSAALTKKWEALVRNEQALAI